MGNLLRIRSIWKYLTTNFDFLYYLNDIAMGYAEIGSNVWILHQTLPQIKTNPKMQARLPNQEQGETGESKLKYATIFKNNQRLGFFGFWPVLDKYSHFNPIQQWSEAWPYLMGAELQPKLTLTSMLAPTLTLTQS